MSSKISKSSLELCLGIPSSIFQAFGKWLLAILGAFHLQTSTHPCHEQAALMWEVSGAHGICTEAISPFCHTSLVLS